MLRRAFLSLAALSAALLLGCETAYQVMEADPIPPTKFLPHPERLQRMEASFPFNRFWYKKDCDWQKYTKVKIDNVNISYMMAQDWWQKVSETKAAGMRNEAASLGVYMKNAFIREIMKSPKHALSLAETPDANTTIVQLALVQLVPTKAFFNAAGTVAGFFIPGASLVNVLNAGCIAMECKVLDGKTGEVILMFSSREEDAPALIDLRSLTWYGNAQNTIDNWAVHFAEMATKKNADNLQKEFPFSIIAVPK